VALLRLGLQRYFVRGPRRAGIRAPLTSHTD